MHVVFGAYELDTDKRELRRSDKVVPIEPKAFNVLVHLLTHRDRAVSKSELLETLWPEEYVTEAVLTRSVRLIRQAVGDAGHQQRIIKTLRGYGYRFVADVNEHPAEAMRETPPERLLRDVADDPMSETTLAVESAPQPSVSPPPVQPSADAERRPLTVLVCDLVHASHLVEQLDPEDLRQVIRACHTACERVLAQFEGYLAQRSGSRLVVYFGYPQAQEDAAQRAVLTGLGLIEALSAFNPEIIQGQEDGLRIRVGIDSGLVVVETGGDEHAAPLAIGSPQSRAVQLQEVAAPQSVVISADTLHLVQGWFRCDELVSHVFQGAASPVPVYQITGRSGVQHRLEVVTPAGLTPLVGREQEVGLMSERWQRVCEGQGQVVVLSGEAGIGKSRLVQVLKDDVIHEPHVQWECRSSPYYQNTALYPITDLLQRILDWRSTDAPSARLEKLEAFLSQSRLPVSDTVPLLAPLLSVPLPETRYPPLGLSPQRQRQQTLESIVALLLEQTVQQPVLLILEDLHWLDPTSLDLLKLLVDQAPTASLLMLLTGRPELQPPWRQRSFLTQITLNRLSRSQIALMAEQVAAGMTLPGEVLQQIVVKTDGIPLFVEEMTKAVLESGILKDVDGQYQLTGTVSILSIPATLQDSLMSRLDRLVTAKGVAQYASVIGRQFSYELLHAVSGLDETMLQHELGRLVEAELIYQRGSPPHSTYTFKHALVQDTAYESLLRHTRRAYHQRIAEVLVERFPEMATTQPELLAYHYSCAALHQQAVLYWKQAGERAVARSAHDEAIEYYRKALASLKNLSVTPERTKQKLSLLIALGLPLMAIQGYGSPEVVHVYSRARDLCQQMGETTQLIQILVGLGRAARLRAELHTAQASGEQAFALAQRIQNDHFLILTHLQCGVTVFFLGQFRLALTHLERVLSRYDVQRHANLVTLHGDEPRTAALTYIGLVYFHLGYPDTALQYLQEALTLAEMFPDSLTYAYVLTGMIWCHQYRREGQETQRYGDMVMALSIEQGFAHRLAQGRVLKGWARATQGHCEEGLAEMRQGLASYQATGAALYLPYYYAMLSEIYGLMGERQEALHLLNEALAAVDRTGECIYAAELHRLKGELLLHLSAQNTLEADSYFQQAIAIAQHQQAKSWELRAATSLAKLWQSQHKCQEAYDLLALVFYWFTEGLETADLIDAKSLLDELNMARVP